MSQRPQIDKAFKAVSRAYEMFNRSLRSDETVLAAEGLIVLTDFRLIQYNIASKIKKEIPIEVIVGLAVEKKGLGGGPLLVEMVDGSTHKIGNLMYSRIDDFLTMLEIGRTGQIPEDFHTLKSMSQTKKELTKRKDDTPHEYGRIVMRKGFGTSMVTLFENGYVKISKGLGLLTATQGYGERLVDIEGESQIWKKTGLGRALTGVVTMGLNQFVPNQRGNLVLTITTDINVHVLLHEMPYKHDITNMTELVSAGRAIIAKNEMKESKSNSSVSQNTPTIAEQIKDLAKLRDEGIITQEEFESAKSKLLS